jgi:hypothetical protein
MNHNNFRHLSVWAGVAVMAAAMLACNLSTSVTPGSASVPANAPASAATIAPTDTLTVPAGNNNPATATPASTETATNTPIVHVITPGEPPAASLSALTDANSSALASQHRANGGDNFSANLFERPFTSNSMDYIPDLDITGAKLSSDATWIYVTISLTGQNSVGGLPGDYGVELDLNVDGRGDVLVMAAKPAAAWSTDGVQVWTDSNKDVGGAHPILSDPPSNTDGYDKLVFDQGAGSDPDTAWARISPSDSNSVQIAFKNSLINNSGTFMWGAWAMDKSMLNPAWFDYNDHFTLAQAGSPLVEDTTNYPLKALAQVDNTCRWVVGFTPTGNEPGICPVPATPTPRPTATPIKPGTVSGTVYNNGINGGLNYNSSVSKPASGVSVSVRSGGCGSPGSVAGTTTTAANGTYGFTLNAGTYCVSAATGGSNQTGPQTVNVTNGGAVHNVNFFYYTYLG